MDALADILKTIRLHTSTYLCSDFNQSWGLKVAPSSSGMFHVMIEGSAWLQTDKQDKAIHLEQGDIVAFPTGGAHVISDMINSESLPSMDVVERINRGENPFFHASNSNRHLHHTLLCGGFEYDSTMNHPFLKSLPCFIHIKASDTPELDWLRALVKVVAVESKIDSPGGELIVDRLTEVLFIQLLRVYMSSHNNTEGYLLALNDPRIGKALTLIHNEPDKAWNVNTLANEAALSRSAFTDRFTRLVGESPKSYLINWRMQKAKVRLRDSQMSMQEIAEKTGYSSEAAFSKAFKQMFDVSPGSLRKRH